MLKEKNKVMLIISVLVLVLSFVVHIMHRSLNLFQSMDHSMEKMQGLESLQNIILLVPLLITIITLLCIRFQSRHQIIPLLNTLSLTLSSISLIAGGSGMVEYHFSIFMVLAIIVYYEKVVLLLVSTVLFAAQHIIGYFWFKELVFGSSHYSFGMILIHIIFVVLFDAGVIYQIVNRRHVLALMEREQNEKLHHTVGQIIQETSASSEGVMGNSQILLAASTDLNSLSNQILDVMNQLSDVSKNQELGTQQSAASMGEVADGITVIANISLQTSDEVSESSQEVMKGEQYIQSAISWMTKVNEAMQLTAQKFGLLDQHAKEIEDATSMNNNISTQTKILALNASIEATRAGEHGRGFAVVAEEIRKLADQSSHASEKIAGLIAAIQEEIVSSTIALDQAAEQVEEGNQAVILSGDAFQAISKSIQTVMQSMSTVAAKSQQISISTEEITGTFTGIAQTSRNLANDVNQVSKLSEEQIELIRTCSGLAMKMEQFSKQLNEIIAITRGTFIPEAMNPNESLT